MPSPLACSGRANFYSVLLMLLESRAISAAATVAPFWNSINTARTIETYRHQLHKIIWPRIGDLRISEASTGPFFMALDMARRWRFVGHESTRRTRLSPSTPP